MSVVARCGDKGGEITYVVEWDLRLANMLALGKDQSVSEPTPIEAFMVYQWTCM